MKVIEPGYAGNHSTGDLAPYVVDDADVRVDAHSGGLVFIGPTQGELQGLANLNGIDGIETVEAIGKRMMSWASVSAEVIEVGRRASQLIRQGLTAVVHLDCHVGQAQPIPCEARDFVCARLGQIMIGIADVPAFVAVHGERMARALIVDSLGDHQIRAKGCIGGCPLWQLSNATMFPGLAVTMCPEDRPADALAPLLDWFDTHRQR